jgi:hypothetical protein
MIDEPLRFPHEIIDRKIIAKMTEYLAQRLDENKGDALMLWMTRDDVMMLRQTLCVVVAMYDV